MKQRKKAVIAVFAILKLLVLVLVAVAFLNIGRKAYSFGYQVFAEETVSDSTGEKGGCDDRGRYFCVRTF